MTQLNVFDIIGPVMIGPSSSHTAGAVRIGKIARAILGEAPVKVDIYLHGSFAQTYRGHGTDLALVAGLLGFDPADEGIKHSLAYAGRMGMEVNFHRSNLGEVHPNTAKLVMHNRQGGTLQVTGSSVGGGSIMVTDIDGFPVELSGEYQSLIIVHQDRPGVISKVTAFLGQAEVNIAKMKVSRQEKGAPALMIIETDQPVTLETLNQIKALDQVDKAVMIEPL